MFSIPFYQRLRFKLAAVYILLVATIIAVACVFSFQAAEKQFHHLLLHEFKNTRSVTNNFLKFVEQTALITARSSVADKELQEILTIDDTKALASRLKYQMRENTADAITLLNHEGRVLARGHDPQSFGDSLLSFDFVNDAIGGKEAATAIVQDLGSFILYGTAAFIHPITREVLYILAGYALNNNFVDHIQKNSCIEVSLVRERSIISTTLYSNGQRVTTLPIPYLEYEMLLANPGQVLEAHFLGRDYFISAERLPFMQTNMAGSMLLVHAQDELTAVKKVLAERFVLIFAGSLVVGVLLIILFVKAALRPVRQLIRATKKISAGDLQNRIKIDSKDELGLLSEHFNKMADAVQEKDNVLKQYSKDLERQVEERAATIVEQSVLLDNVLRSSKDLAIVITDTDLEVKYFNPVAEKIFNHKAEDVIGRRMPEIHELENVVHNCFEDVMAIVRERGVYNYDAEQKREGEVLYVESSVTGVLDKHGTLGGFVLVARDVSKRRKMEQRILENRKFETISILAGGLAHDFNNLLQVIIGGISYARILAKDDVSLDPLLVDVEKGAQQAAQLSNDMLILSQGGYWPKKNCNLRPLLEKEAKLAGSDIVSCAVEIADDLWLVDGSQELLKDAIGNIVENALAAMPKGGMLTITAKNLQADLSADLPLVCLDRVEIVIGDTGIGISPKNLSQIFDPYFSTKERGSQKGMGLGLATVFAIIKKHDGQIAVQSEEGIGTTITIYLPAVTD